MTTSLSEPTPRQRTEGRLLVAAAALLWSTSGFFAKAPIFSDWPPESRGILLAFWRAAFASAVLATLVRQPRWSMKLIPMTLLFVAMNYTFLTAMVMTTETNAIWLQHIAPVWVFFVGVYVFKEKIHRGDWSMVVFVVLGLSIILAFESQGQQRAGILLGIGGGVTYAGVVLAIRQLRSYDSAWLIFVNHLVTVLFFAPIVLYQGIWPTPTQLAVLAGFGILQMGLPYLLFARALRWIPGHEASAIVLLEPIVTPLWVYLAWGGYPTYVPPSKWTLLGACFILFGLVVRFAVVRRGA